MTKIKKVIYIIETRFNKRDYDRFGIEILKKNGFEVEVWDFTPFLGSHEYRRIEPPDPIKWDKLILFEEEKKALDALLGLDPSAYIVSLVPYTKRSFNLYKAIARKKTPYCVQGFALPRSTTDTEIFKSRVKKFTFKKLARKIVETNPLRYLSVTPADIILTAGEKFNTVGSLVNRKSEVLWAHNFDYDAYLSIRDLHGASDPKVGVFLDEYFPYHPDFVNVGVKWTMTHDEYYPLLCRFFDYLERKSGVKIIIAAHPRSHYEKHGDCFNGRKVIRGKTAQLVKESGFVLIHHSTAINYAVLFNKPIIFMTTNKLDGAFIEDPSVAWLAKYFGKKAHNLDEPIDIDFNEEMKINARAYKNYKNDYIKKEGSPELPSWQILAERLLNR
ncbi:MAG: hypothetical protein A3I43_03550 [Omnitrophica WOR_2 bacterium RIFCSPLOWO2_02_FULL_50_19]|nr:MAG: hypothetical protein A3I43_03550 [Omnitrophica WOR_2 bacterium RIFCSPLOWO2_02_FULL_50_19]